MKLINKKYLIISIILLVITCIVTYIALKQVEKQNNIELIEEQSNIVKVQENLEQIDTISDMFIDVDNSNAIGTIKIEKIDYEGFVFEGTGDDVLEKGIGHFESSPILEGNVCLAGHNYTNIWADLYTLQNGDIIEYTSILGKKIYEVFEIKEIFETDLSILEETENNMISLITCIENQPQKRLYVGAIEKN